MGLETLPDDLVAYYVGNGAPVLIKRAMDEGASEAQLEEALAYFLAIIASTCSTSPANTPASGSALAALHAKRTPMAVLTNKPVRFSKEILVGLKLDRYFFQVYGGNSFVEKKPHPVGIDKLIEEAGAARERTWMVGDSSVDVLTARNAGVKAVGVSYGLKPKSLSEAPPDLLLDSLADLPAHIVPPRSPCSAGAGGRVF